MNVTWFWNNCSRQAQRLSLLAAGMLPEAERAPLEAHLDRCPACQARLKRTKALAKQLRAAGEAMPPLEPPFSLRRRWREAVLQEANASAEPSLARTQPVLDWLAAWIRGGRLAWGAVCACWLLVAFFRASAPDVSRPAVAATSATWKEIRMALQKIERRSPPLPAAQDRPHDVEPLLQTPSPRTERGMTMENT